MVFAPGRIRARLVGRRNDRRVAEASCTQVVDGTLTANNTELTACSGEATLAVLRFTATFPADQVHPTLLAFELAYAAGHWTGNTVAPDGQTAAVDFWCDGSAWQLQFTWHTTTLTATPVSVANGLNSFHQTYSGTWTYAGKTGTLAMEVTS